MNEWPGFGDGRCLRKYDGEVELTICTLASRPVTATRMEKPCRRGGWSVKVFAPLQSVERPEKSAIIKILSPFHTIGHPRRRHVFAERAYMPNKGRSLASSTRHVPRRDPAAVDLTHQAQPAARDGPISQPYISVNATTSYQSTWQRYSHSPPRWGGIVDCCAHFLEQTSDCRFWTFPPPNHVSTP